MTRKSPHAIKRDARYYETRCAALAVRVRELEAAIKALRDGMLKHGDAPYWQPQADALFGLLPTVGKTL